MMNYAAQSIMKTTATVWTPITDDDGYASYGSPYTITCHYTQGGKLQIDGKGEEFQPASTYRTFSTTPKLGDKIKVGDHTTQPTPSDAETIRKVGFNQAHLGTTQSIPIFTG